MPKEQWPPEMGREMLIAERKPMADERAIEAAETPMSDHVARFWRLLETEYVRILIEKRRSLTSGTYWDSSSFGNDVAKALVADRAAHSTPDGSVRKP